MKTELKTFIRSYVETALWSSTHSNAYCEGCGENLDCQVDDVINCPKCGSTEIVETSSNLDDAHFSDHVFTLDAMRKIVRDCKKFMESPLFVEAVESFYNELSSTAITQIAHDFWLTRNRHGAGFWDRDYPKALGEKLTEFSHTFGEVHILPEDDMFHME
jgi:hypothetical protein